jgi:hypothetical protein
MDETRGTFDSVDTYLDVPNPVIVDPSTVFKKAVDTRLFRELR